VTDYIDQTKALVLEPPKNPKKPWDLIASREFTVDVGGISAKVRVDGRDNPVLRISGCGPDDAVSPHELARLLEELRVNGVPIGSAPEPDL